MSRPEGEARWGGGSWRCSSVLVEAAENILKMGWTQNGDKGSKVEKKVGWETGTEKRRKPAEST